MNQLEIIQSQLNDINNKRVRVQTLMEQAKKQCEEIEKKYNVTSLEELQALMNKSKFGVLYSSLPSKAFCQFALAYSQSSWEKLIPSFTLKTEIGKIAVQPSPSPSSIAFNVSSIIIRPSGEVSVP